MIHLIKQRDIRRLRMSGQIPTVEFVEFLSDFIGDDTLFFVHFEDVEDKL